MAFARVKRGLTLQLVLLMGWCAIFVMQGSSIEAAVYKVGDSVGWTTIGNFDYKGWAANKNFQLGDIILFEYNTKFHNVMQVNHTDYQTCNASAPYATHTSGNDSITLTRRGHHFFLCGVPGHCQSGQKVDINIPLELISTAPTPSEMASPSSVTSAMVPAPAPSEAAPLYGLTRPDLLGRIGFALVVVFTAFL